MNDLAAIVEKLCASSRKGFSDPHAAVEWPANLDRDQWFMSPDLISLQGLPAYDALPESDRRTLSFHEVVNFFSLVLNGEKFLIQGLTQRLYREDLGGLTPYLHHMIDEENKHMIYFGEFCTRYAGKVYPDKKLSVPRDYAPGEEDFLFFARAVIFEDIVDAVNIRLAGDDRVCPTVRRINRIHHEDESRHLAFGRALLREMFGERAPGWSPETLSRVREHLSAYMAAAWKEYCNPSAYRDAGLPNSYQLYEEALASSPAARRRRELSARCVGFLVQSGILLQEPVL